MDRNRSLRDADDLLFPSIWIVITLMSSPPGHIVVVGQGAAGLAAAVSAAEMVRGHAPPIRIILIDKAPEADAGGNTRWSPSNMRMVEPDRVEPSFVQDMLAATDHKGDQDYFETLAVNAREVGAWMASRGVDFIQPPYYLAKGPPRIQPVGGGAGLVDRFVRIAKAEGVDIRYGCGAEELVVADGRVAGVIVSSGQRRETLPADAVILATGGFQGNAEMMLRHFGPGADTMRLISPGTRFATGDGIRMALAIGADRAGDWNGMHAEPLDARDPKSAPVVLVYPYGIVVDRTGRRFFDEGAGLVHETWERFARDIHFNRPGAIAFAILDSRMLAIPDYQRAIRSEVPPVRADDIASLARQIGVDAAALEQTVADYNAACTGDPRRFDATVCDGLAAGKDLAPPKSNWARAISEPPFLAWPLVGAVAYTFGGLATDDRARVLRGGAPIPGLYAAGEITGHFYATAPNSVAVMRAFVFGRIAGHGAAYCVAAGAQVTAD
jgi:tricarballylate dehydrogenase